ncbi:hypothetical protein [Candidatus Spongiihabitans sp.]|uniref:hypothetical protein n=1 Tax=Candidatus Spongiihabitans sp. TaxID=3101308 RepID=UPI003C7C73E2
MMPDQANRNEAQTRLDLITPALIAPGRLQGAGKCAKLKQSHPHQIFTGELTVRRRNLDHTSYRSAAHDHH